MSSPLFWSTPLKYCRWAAREKPALFWSVVIGAAGPLAMPIGPPLRRWLGDVDPAPVPVTYPGAFCLSLPFHHTTHEALIQYLRNVANMASDVVPAGPRKKLTGYDDE